MLRSASIGLAALICLSGDALGDESHPPVRGTIPMLINAADGAPPAEAVDSAEAPGTVTDLLAGEALVESEHDVQDSRGRWAMRELLALGFAQSEGLDLRVAAALRSREDRVLDDEIALMREDAWLEGFERAQALASLRPFTAHQVARVSIQGYDIPIVDHELVDAWIDYFTGRGRWFFERWLGRSERYIPMMQPILEQYGLPKDLVYLAMIESGFSAKAYSPAAAAGYWQFIRGTAKTYGMHMDAWVDERRDYALATIAAAKYLTALHKNFGDWHLAWAGYNAGEGRIGRALAKTGAKTFWELVEQDALPKETQHYVPKIIAAAIVAKNKEHFGFAKYDALKPLVYEEITVNEALDLKLVAKELKVDAEVLRELNPMLVYDITPPGRAYPLRLPLGTSEHIKQWAAALPPSQRLTYATHKIAKGDTLGSIAQIFHTTPQMVQDFNHVKSAKSLRVGQELIIPSLRGIANKDAGPKGVVSPSAADVAKLASATPTPAEASATTASLPAPPAPAPAPTGQASPSPSVASASVQKPAARSNDPNDVIVAAILAKNRDATAGSNPPTARPQKPIAPQPPPKGKASTHVVESGDTLWSISQKYGTSVADVKRWNGIRGNAIKIGDKLKIYAPMTDGAGPKAQFFTVFSAIIIATALIIGAFLVHQRRPAVETAHPSAALVKASGKCAECHRNETSAIVDQYERSRHAAKGINCLDCHQPAPGQEGMDHRGFVITKTLTSKNCAQCHAGEYEQYARSRHAGPSWAAVNGTQGMSAEQQALGEKHHPGWVKRAGNPVGFAEGQSAMTSGCNTCHAVGKPNADGSFGTCTNCHARHAASVALAREPTTCGQCHMGPDHSQIEIYEESKHGALFTAQREHMNLAADPKKLSTEDMSVPTCATCHMSGLEGMKVTHDTTERLSYFLFAPVSEKRPAGERAQTEMKEVCLKCHTKPRIDEFYARAEEVLRDTNVKVKEAQAVIAGLRAEGLLTAKAFDESIEFTEFDLWHYYGRTAKHGAFMGGADFVQWHGNYELLRHKVDLDAEAAALRAAKHK